MDARTAISLREFSDWSGPTGKQNLSSRNPTTRLASKQPKP